MRGLHSRVPLRPGCRCGMAGERSRSTKQRLARLKCIAWKYPMAVRSRETLHCRRRILGEWRILRPCASRMPRANRRRFGSNDLDGRQPEAVFAQAVAAGASEIFPVGEEHGWELGRVVDPFGLHWESGTRSRPDGEVCLIGEKHTAHLKNSGSPRAAATGVRHPELARLGGNRVQDTRGINQCGAGIHGDGHTLGLRRFLPW